LHFSIYSFILPQNSAKLFYLFSFLVKTAENGRLRAQSRATRAINTHGKHHPAHLKPGAALDMKVLSLAMTPFPGLDWE
jgi:hypothetical protein